MASSVIKFSRAQSSCAWENSCAANHILIPCVPLPCRNHYYVSLRFPTRNLRDCFVLCNLLCLLTTVISLISESHLVNCSTPSSQMRVLCSIWGSHSGSAAKLVALILPQNVWIMSKELWTVFLCVLCSRYFCSKYSNLSIYVLTSHFINYTCTI